MFRTTRFLLPALCAASALTYGQPCTTPPGAAVTDGPVSASATFTNPGDGTIVVTVANNLADPRSAGQLLNGVAFTLSEGETTGTLGINTAIIGTVQKGGVFTQIGSNPAPTGWALADNFYGGLELCVLCKDLGGIGPSHLLIGSPAPSGKYDSANASIAGNKPHNPFTTGTASFTIAINGITPTSTVIAATFFFSTTDGVGVAGSCGSGGGKQ
jgi:hypothetical protein